MVDTTKKDGVLVDTQDKDISKKADVVEMSKVALDELLARLAKLEEEQKLSRAVEDKNKLEKIENLRRAGKLVKEVKLRKLDGKIIIGWKLLQDEVYFADGKLIENQKIQVIFDDTTTRDMTMRQWAALPMYETFEVLRESREENGDIYFKVRGSDGKELEINIAYIN